MTTVVDYLNSVLNSLSNAKKLANAESIDDSYSAIEDAESEVLKALNIIETVSAQLRD